MHSHRGDGTPCIFTDDGPCRNAAHWRIGPGDPPDITYPLAPFDHPSPPYKTRRKPMPRAKPKPKPSPQRDDVLRLRQGFWKQPRGLPARPDNVPWSAWDALRTRIRSLEPIAGANRQRRCHDCGEFDEPWQLIEEVICLRCYRKRVIESEVEGAPQKIWRMAPILGAPDPDGAQLFSDAVEEAQYEFREEPARRSRHMPYNHEYWPTRPTTYNTLLRFGAEDPPRDRFARAPQQFRYRINQAYTPPAASLTNEVVETLELP